MPITEMLWALWGKFDPTIPNTPEHPNIHPLLCHLCDVASVALLMLEQALPPSTLQKLTKPLGLPQEHAFAWIAFFVALHDLGKATPAFQDKCEEQKLRLQQLGLCFPLDHNKNHHGVLGISEIARILPEVLQIDEAKAFRLGRCVCAHHGSFPCDTESSDENQFGPDWGDSADSTWRQLRENIVEQLAQWLHLRERPKPHPDFTLDHAWIILLAGLCSVADWIGSMDAVFVFSPPPNTLEEYALQARQRAHQALDFVRWPKRSPPRSARGFAQLFPKLSSPWPLHTTTQSLLPDLLQPSLIMIEAPMGEGKTEAALMLADALCAQVGHDGFFIGLPTQATSNAMIRRAEAFLEHVYEQERINLHLVHGDAALQKDYRDLKLKAIYATADPNHATADPKKPSPEVLAEQWFCNKKRALLANYAVGTIDQALLSAMQVRHGFVRLFGLSAKTVLLDEVHAYDTYTSTLIDRLIEWFWALGTSVIVLSATLPSRRRNELLKAYGAPQDVCKYKNTPYPRITMAMGGEIRALPVTSRRPPADIALEWLSEDSPRAIAEGLIAALEQGGCAAWICNTVARAQEAYSILKELLAKIPNAPELGLIHARMLHGDRQIREQKALLDFGRDECQRPQRAILVGTQVLEQSLDFDFDIMISDFAPIDLLFQRAGRLHRHERREPRPKALQNPRFCIVRPKNCDGPKGPSFEAMASVYEKIVLLRTWLALQHKKHWTFPLDIEPLIESVYAENLAPEELVGLPSAYAERMQEALRRFNKDQREHKAQAGLRLLPTPKDTDDIFAQLGMTFEEEEDKDMHKSLKALTRLGDPSLQVICLYGDEKRPTLDREGQKAIDLRLKPTPAQCFALLQNGLRISHKSIVDALMKEDIPEAFRQSPSLCHRHILIFGPTPIDYAGYKLSLDAELGLIIESAAHRDRT